jgi:hypothetical protein
MKRYFFILLVSLLTLSLHAQNVKITGKVVSSADNEPLIGVYVKVPGTSIGAVTDIDGNFAITADKNATIEVTMIGYNTQKIALGGRTSLNVILKDAVSDLNEVVVIGYGAVKKVILPAVSQPSKVTN